MSWVVPKKGAISRGPETSSPSETTPPTKTKMSKGRRWGSIAAHRPVVAPAVAFASGAGAEAELPRGVSAPSDSSDWGARSVSSVRMRGRLLKRGRMSGRLQSGRRELEATQHRQVIAIRRGGELLLGRVERDQVRLAVMDRGIDLYADVDGRGCGGCAILPAGGVHADQPAASLPADAVDRHDRTRPRHALEDLP